MTFTNSPTQNNFIFPVGFHAFHKDKQINLLINRWYSLGYWIKADAEQAGIDIQNQKDWQGEFVSFAERMNKEGRDLATAFSYRTAEFLTHPNDPEKMALYNLFYELFYKTIQGEQMEQHSIPYQGGSLPALRFLPERSKGTIVLHGGLDSFMEEFYSVARYVFSAGYDIILFEGPGQGAARRKSNLYMTYEWEKPTAAILDYFKLPDITLVGVSMGGFLAPRAAAFDQRIGRVVAYDVTPYDLRGSGLQGAIYQFLIKNPSVYNWIAKTSMRMSAPAEQLISQWMYITGAHTPAEWNEQLQYYSIAEVASQIRQDVLLLAGEEDHLIPIQEYYNNMKGYPNAKSVTGRIFTKEEHAQNHCQVGNVKLALDVIMKWVEEKS
jgi:pimeloyl-ACP methyl ester carboxylesterase